MKLQVLETAPEKPRKGEPCNGCGFCCAAEVCEIGLAAMGPDTQAPCPAMEFSEGRFWCGIVKAEDELGVFPLVRLMLGIGKGCDADD